MCNCLTQYPVMLSIVRLQNMKLLLGQEEGLRHGLEAQVKELQLKLKHSQSPDSGKESLLKVGNRVWGD